MCATKSSSDDSAYIPADKSLLERSSPSSFFSASRPFSPSSRVPSCNSSFPLPFPRAFFFVFVLPLPRPSTFTLSLFAVIVCRLSRAKSALCRLGYESIPTPFPSGQMPPL